MRGRGARAALKDDEVRLMSQAPKGYEGYTIFQQAFWARASIGCTGMFNGVNEPALTLAQAGGCRTALRSLEPIARGNLHRARIAGDARVVARVTRLRGEQRCVLLVKDIADKAENFPAAR